MHESAAQGICAKNALLSWIPEIDSLVSGAKEQHVPNHYCRMLKLVGMSVALQGKRLSRQDSHAEIPENLGLEGSKVSDAALRNDLSLAAA